MTSLAKELNMRTITEGVETMIQVNQLKKVKCDLIQGYVYYKPMSIDKLNKIIENNFEIIEV